MLKFTPKGNQSLRRTDQTFHCKILTISEDMGPRVRPYKQHSKSHFSVKRRGSVLFNEKISHALFYLC